MKNLDKVKKINELDPRPASTIIATRLLSVARKTRRALIVNTRR